MVGLLLGGDRSLVPGARSDDLVARPEYVRLQRLYGRGLDPVLATQLEHGLQRRLRVSFRVVTLHDGLAHRIQALSVPVQLELPGDRLHEALAALEDLGRPGDALHRQKGSVDGGEGDSRIGKTLPVRYSSCPGDAKRVEG